MDGSSGKWLRVRGVFNRQASKVQAAKNGRRDPNFEFGTNPCSEIILRPYQFCNLTECVVRATDTIETLERKVRIATILGTIQSTHQVSIPTEDLAEEHRRRTVAWGVIDWHHGQPAYDIEKQRTGGYT